MRGPVERALEIRIEEFNQTPLVEEPLGRDAGCDEVQRGIPATAASTLLVEPCG